MTGTVKNVVDVVAIGGATATWIDWLPDIAAGLSIVWLALRIGDWLWQKCGKRAWARVRRLLFPFS